MSKIESSVYNQDGEIVISLRTGHGVLLTLAEAQFFATDLGESIAEAVRSVPKLCAMETHGATYEDQAVYCEDEGTWQDTDGTWFCDKHRAYVMASAATADGDPALAPIYEDEPFHIGDTCCGKCPGATCYVDQVTGA